LYFYIGIIIPLYLCCSQKLTHNEKSQQTVAAQDEESAETPRTEGPEIIEDELTMPMQIEKPMRQHNKPKKA
jgi:hypothetical protein